METRFKEISGRHTPDAWLDPFLPALGVAGDLVLELGCGSGEDSATLAAYGFRVVACDRSRKAIRAAVSTVPAASFFEMDMEAPFAVRDGVVRGVVASLSLHYFPWSATQAILAEVCRVLVPGGAFLFRVNATDDVNFGAGAGAEIEPGFYRVPSGRNHRPHKRFFDEAMVRALLEPHWRIAHLAHRTIHRYGDPKQVWECLAFAE